MDVEIGANKAPVGVVKQTLIPCPVIKYIFRCRSLDEGDDFIVILREHSISIGSFTYPLPSLLRSATIAPFNSIENRIAQSNHHRAPFLQELKKPSSNTISDATNYLFQGDLLLLSLASGWVLYLRPFEDGSMPQVVASVQVGNGIRAGLSGVGHAIHADFSGSAMAVSGLSDNLMLFSVRMSKTEKNSEIGVIIGSQKNIEYPGSIIISSCFLHPLKGTRSQQVLFAILYATPENTLKLSLYEWWNYLPIETAHELGVITLSSDIAVPSFIVPVHCDGGIMLVCETELVFITVSDVISAQFVFNRIGIPADVGFPVTYYQPTFSYQDGGTDDSSSTVNSTGTENTVFYFTTDVGNIFAVDVRPKLRLSGYNIILENIVFLDIDLGNSFNILPVGDENLIFTEDLAAHNDAELEQSFWLSYGGDFSQGCISIVSRIQPDTKISIVEEIVSEFDNWGPASDGLPVRSSSSDEQDLWVCSGGESTGAITRLRTGINATAILHNHKTDHDSLFSISTRGNIFPSNYLVLTSIGKTQIYLTLYDSLLNEDKPLLDELNNACGLEMTRETIAIDFLSEVSKFALQVTSDGLIATDLYGWKANYELKSQGKIIYASIWNNYVCLVASEDRSEFEMTDISSQATGYRFVQIFRIDENYLNDMADQDLQNDSWIEQLGETINVPYPVIFIKFLVLGGQTKLLIGTSYPSLIMYDFNDKTILGNRVEIIDMFDTRDDYYPHDAIVSYQREQEYLLIGLRNGLIIACKFENNSLKSQISRKMGDKSVTFQSMPNDKIYVASNSIYQFEYKACLEVPVKVYFDPELRRNEVRITSIVPIFANEPSAESGFNYLALISRQRLSLFRANLDSAVNSTKIHIGSTTRRIVSTYMGLLAVSIVSPYNSKPGYRNHLAFIDPKTCKIVSSSNLSDSGATNAKGEKLKQPIFKPSEIVHSICEWRLTVENNCYLFFVVGTGTRGKAYKGQIRVLSIVKPPTTDKNILRGYKVSAYLKTTWRTEGPVYTICQHDSTSIIYSMDKKINICKFIDKKIDRIEVDNAEFPSSIVHLSSNGHQITVSTLNNSVFIIEIHDNRVVHIHTDKVLRNTLNHASLNDSSLVLCDKDRFIVGLCKSFYPQDHGDDANLATSPQLSKCFKLKTPSMVSRVRPFPYSPIWVRNSLKNSSEVLQSYDNRFIGIAIDGSVYGFRILDSDEFKRLGAVIDKLDPTRSELNERFQDVMQYFRGGYGVEEKEPDIIPDSEEINIEDTRESLSITANSQNSTVEVGEIDYFAILDEQNGSYHTGETQEREEPIKQKLLMDFKSINEEEGYQVVNLVPGKTEWANELPFQTNNVLDGDAILELIKKNDFKDEFLQEKEFLNVMHL
ncbi:hypothetical protein NADFUDRAFT_53476 [Nadsonia fulvescens var. elongata DSM 6958]|uniref:RSE1/DDB1/CPSF1 first beta-propeller domain-containing protein n=1 Tax=Nadsonia fulvescens var. elongata DSM 6958 TaxID=857566 RepID=A0A1E3PCV7_9ASCO|nr:hypothetical protein NADFUDRAFT_53476 [Nadsonia fulvescens var. elongata DSM 6958]